ncbi:MAG: hypothetical protein KOO60_06830, partial [Gemmatimonadales bacterium]|nr:hypothetical protein [Gemmatimonadales bacterium]
MAAGFFLVYGLSRSLVQVAEELRRYLLGWKGYFQLADTPKIFSGLNEWLRHRLRARGMSRGQATKSGGQRPAPLSRFYHKTIYNRPALFTMPIRLRIETESGPLEVTVQNSLASETYPVTVPDAVTSVDLDPDHWILRQIQTTVDAASLDQGILLVNGVDWGTYDSEITSAYTDSTFWGSNPITFWDCFNEPSGGYPANLPTPLGHGPVPADIIGDFSTVIWVGNNYNGDLAKWAETPILSYLEAGGNVLLMSRRSSTFLVGDLATYLGVSFVAIDGTLGNCIAVDPGLVDIPFIGTQSFNDVYLTNVDPGTLIFQDTEGFSGTRGTGAWVAPEGGGTFRSDGGRLVHITGRPYRMDHDALRQNVEYILANHLLEPYNPYSPVGDTNGNGSQLVSARIVLGNNFPNPFNPQTIIPFSLPKAANVSLSIYDARGRLVR